MTRYPRWKFFLLLAVLLGCGLYALPNLYPDVPAIQISANDAGGQVPVPVRDRVLGALDDAGIEHGEGETINNSWMVRLESTDAQLRARERISSLLGEEYVVALNLAPTTPDWLRAVGASPMNLGLDLRGGVHFLLQVDMATVIEQRMDAWSGQAKLTLRNEGIRYRSVDIEGQKLVITLDDQIAADAARAPLRTALPEFTLDQSEERPRLTLTLNQSTLDELQDYAVDQNRTALNNRVNELGVGNAVVQRQGADRIVVQLPGVQDASQARRILGRTATLEFRLVADQYSSSRASTGIAPPGTEIFPFKSQNDRPVILEKSKIATGDQVTNAQMGFDQQSGTPQVNVELDSTGARSMQRVTSKNVGNPMSVLFIETKTVMKTVEGEDGERRQVPESTTDQYVINVATIQDTLGSRFRITGLDSPAEASELALLLRAGSLAAPVTIVEERTIGPSLGQENIEAGLKSMALGMALVLLFMVIWYKVFGLFANVALLGNLVIIVGVMSLIPGATLTLPGIAGIVLTLGMAVDANVLIYERIREEIRNGRGVQQAIHLGFDRAFSTIADSNITSLITCVILFGIGTGAIKGFALTLGIGLTASMFTAITVSRAIINLAWGGRRIDKLPI